MRADLILYFEIKSADHQRRQRSQLQSNLTALQEETPDGAAFLAGVGGKPIQIQHQRWLGHVTLDGFLEETAEVARTELPNTGLAGEIEGIRLFKNRSA